MALPEDAGLGGRAELIAENGLTFGVYFDQDGNEQLIIWNEDEFITETAPGGYIDVDPASINADGSILVGNLTTEQGEDEPFIWTAADGIMPLSTLTSLNDSIPAGWSAVSSDAISDNGRYLLLQIQSPFEGFELDPLTALIVVDLTNYVDFENAGTLELSVEDLVINFGDPILESIVASSSLPGLPLALSFEGNNDLPTLPGVYELVARY